MAESKERLAELINRVLERLMEGEYGQPCQTENDVQPTTEPSTADNIQSRCP